MVAKRKNPVILKLVFTWGYINYKFMNRLLATLISCLFFLNIMAQTSVPVKGGVVGQSQLINTYLKAKQMGLSDNEIKNQLIKRGYPASSINEIKKIAQNKQTTSVVANAPVSTIDNMPSTNEAKRDSSWVFKRPLAKEASPFFGYGFFSESYLDYMPNTNMATPENYILGPGDMVNVTVSGLNTKEISGYITPEGYYTLPYLGMIQLSGVTIEAAKKMIPKKLSKIYPAINNGTTQVYVSLGELRTIQVMVTGEANRPGGYMVSSSTNLFNLLYLSGGPTENGSLRKIQLIRKNKIINEIDFYEFIRTGILNNNIRLEDQDVIHYVIYGKRVKIEGEVKIPSIFELKEKENLQDLIKFAGGFSENAFSKQLTIKTKSENNLLIKNVIESDYSKYNFLGGEEIIVGSIDQRYENKVIISGEISRPGSYGLIKDETLQQLILRAGGIKEDAFANRGYIQRKIPGLNIQMLPFDTKQIIKGEQSDILLVKNDSVVIYSSNTFLNNSSVTINGGVKNPGTYNFSRGMKVEDLIALAGGFTIDAAYHKVELSRLEKNKSENLSNQVLGRQMLHIDSALHTTNASVQLEAFDDVFVPRLLNYRLLGNVKIRGEVLYEGDYTLEKRDETVLEIVARSGGITPFASITDIQIFRNGLRIGTDMFNKSMVLQNKEPLHLLPGDSIYIPRKNDFVVVQGAVFNEQIVEYNGGNFMEYISAVGGTKTNAHLKKAYVQYPNGKYKKTNRFLFMRFYPRITPGSKIFIPEKSLVDMKPISVSDITGAATLLTSLVAIFSILKK